MSLRTKLLAAIVGLPGAILLIALVVFVRGEPRTPNESIDRVIQLAAKSRYVIGPALLEEIRAGHFAAAYVVVEAQIQDPETFPAMVFTAEAHYDEQRRGDGPDVRDAKLHAQTLRRYAEAVVHRPPIILRRDFLAVRAEQPNDQKRDYGFVIHLHAPGDAAQTVYWVMVSGIALLMIVFFWLVSKWVIRPLDKLSAAADRIATGDFGVAIEPHDAADEFGRTIRALNRMASEIAEYQGHLEDRVLSALGRIKKAEQHLTIAQRLAATGKLASGLAHEINNPLGGMKNAIRALSRGDLPAEKTTLYLDLVTDGLTRVEQTVKKFLSFTPRTAEARPTDLGETASKGVALAMHRIRKGGIQLETQVPEAGAAVVYGDAHELQQVALNLVLNAADAIGESSDGRIAVHVEQVEDEVELRVSDNGSGMSLEDQGRCFDMFFTTKDVGEGSGMGLAVVHNIVTNHGGRIELASTPGEGTTFTVVLPAETARVEAAAEAEEAGAPSEPSSSKRARKA